MEVMAQPPKASEQNKCPLGGAGPKGCPLLRAETSLAS